MYDDEQLSQSETYFSILQLLRVFSQTITQGERDLQSLANTCCGSLKIDVQDSPEGAEEKEAIKIIMENWKMIMSSHGTHARQLRETINQKTEEFKSLRDGVRLLIIIHRPRGFSLLNLF